MASEHFDAVIIGSGFGGSVMAYRLAQANLRVCLLERGKAWPPHSFPRSPYNLKTNFWDPSAGMYGMFSVWAFKGFGGLVSSGLGGGSLIYANVMLRKDEKWFVHEDLQNGGYEYWPVSRANLEPHYDTVEKVMNAQRYPFHLKPYSDTGKTGAMRDAAQRLGLNFQLPPLAVSFRTRPNDLSNPDDVNNPPLVGEPIVEAQPNYHGRTRTTCVLCGECDIGCNTGSKNTLDYTYITHAKHAGADIRTLCEVRRFEPLTGGGFQVDYVQHDSGREGRKFDTSQLPLTTITSDRLILSAGTFGTPFLLLKNRAAVPRISKKLGTRFCVNGDLLSIISRCKEDTLGIQTPRVTDPSFGPVITSAIRVGDSEDGEEGRGFYVEDGGNPQFLSFLADLTDVSNLPGRLANFGARAIAGMFGATYNADFDAAISQVLGTSDLSRSSFPVLSMGRDIPNGNMRLKGKLLEIDWKIDESQTYYDRLRGVVRSIADSLGAGYEDNPAYTLLRQIFTAHPLGGCPMGRNADEGVVDSNGEVFGYPGLYIADGSVMPGPVGANPALTIAALSDRFAEGIIDARKGK